MRKLRHLTILVLVLALLAVACGDDDNTSGSDPADTSGSDPADTSGSDPADDVAEEETADSITVYSGRDEELIGPFLEAFSDATGIAVEVQYADSAELALLIQAEGDSSPADVFISQSPGALGFLAGEDRLAELDESITGLVDPAYAASDGTWVGLTARVRVLVYNEELVDASTLPTSVSGLTDPDFAGQVAVAPTNGSFQDFVTAMRSELGDEATLEWLEGMAANGSPNYEGNSPIVEAVGRGEIPMGLVNHYYNVRALEADPSLPSRNHFFASDDIGSLVVITGGSVLSSSDAQSAGEQLLEFLLGAEAQAQFVDEIQEYPVLAGVATPEGLPALGGYAADTIDYEVLGEGLTGTIELIRESGIEQ